MDKQELLDALRAATGPSRELDAEIEVCVGGGEVVWKTANYTMEQYPAIRRPSKHHVGGFANEHCPLLTTSLDAAVAFCERMLPGWRVRWQTDGDGTHEAFVENKADFGAITANETCEFGCTAGISICAAVLAALLAQETGK